MYAVILSFFFLIYYKVSVLRGVGILLKNEYMENINVHLTLIRDNLTSLSSSGPFFMNRY